MNDQLTPNQTVSLRSHLAHNLELLARPEWLAGDPRRQPALERHNASITRRLEGQPS